MVTLTIFFLNIFLELPYHMITMSLLIILNCFTKNTLSICNVPYMLGLNCPGLSWFGLIELDTLMEMEILNCLTDERMCSEKKAKNLK